MVIDALTEHLQTALIHLLVDGAICSGRAKCTDYNGFGGARSGIPAGYCPCHIVVQPWRCITPERDSANRYYDYCPGNYPTGQSRREQAECSSQRDISVAASENREDCGGWRPQEPIGRIREFRHARLPTCFKSRPTSDWAQTRNCGFCRVDALKV